MFGVKDPDGNNLYVFTAILTGKRRTAVLVTSKSDSERPRWPERACALTKTVPTQPVARLLKICQLHPS